ncbi:hypothetical protein NDU88_007578 [Pleurodeles waltl]|uniref:Uncharacterized protein n=1 Tax=Pleurodeles waltl TaxID=8319 RepID=A0AAV7RVA6_PLEWA|nr:hypothetical protein NDU88_007578 [Pleurodeles waltl]
MVVVGVLAGLGLPIRPPRPQEGPRQEHLIRHTPPGQPRSCGSKSATESLPHRIGALVLPAGSSLRTPGFSRHGVAALMPQQDKVEGGARVSATRSPLVSSSAYALEQAMLAGTPLSSWRGCHPNSVASPLTPSESFPGALLKRQGSRQSTSWSGDAWMRDD